MKKATARARSTDVTLVPAASREMSFGGGLEGAERTKRETALWSPTRLVLVKFPDVATANRFYDSPEYQEVLKISQQSARRTVVLIEGI